MTFRGAGSVWPFFGLAFVHGVRERDRCSGRSRAHAVARPAGDPRERARPALDRVPALGSSQDLRSAASSSRSSAELVYIVAIVLSLVALGCVLALRQGRVAVTEGVVGLDEVLAGVRLIRRTNVLFGAISLDLFAVLLGGAVALLPIFAKDILDVGPTGLGLPPHRARDRLARRRVADRALPDPSSGRPDAVRRRRGVRRLHGRVRALAGDVAVDARARARRRLRHGERRSPLDDPPARDAGRAPRSGERGRDGLHQRVERARRIRVRRRCGAHRRRAGGRARRRCDGRRSRASGGSSSRHSRASTGSTSCGPSRSTPGSRLKPARARATCGSPPTGVAARRARPSAGGSPTASPRRTRPRGCTRAPGRATAGAVG